MNNFRSDLQKRRLHGEFGAMPSTLNGDRATSRHVNRALALSLGFGASLMFSTSAFAQCAAGATSVSCASDTATTDTAGSRLFEFDTSSDVVVTIGSGVELSGHGLAVRNIDGGVTASNQGAVTVDAGNIPSVGTDLPLEAESAALTLIGNGATLTGGGSVSNLGAGSGVYLGANGDGDILVNVTGDISAVTGHGLLAEVDTADGGSIDITTAGNVSTSSTGSAGLEAKSQSLNGNVTIVANGAIEAVTEAVGAAIQNASATGDVNITTNNLVTSEGVGIYAANAGSGDIIVEANDDVNANFYGVLADHNGSGNVTLNLLGDINSELGDGVHVEAADISGNIDVRAAAVTATGNGGTAIFVDSASEAGNISITTIGDLAGGENGVYAVLTNGNSTGNISIATEGSVSGEWGIFADTDGSGTISIDANDAITAMDGNSITAFSEGGAITITANGALVGTNGVVAENFGTGGVSVITNADINALPAGSAIVAVSGGGTVSVASAGAVSGGRGIAAESAGGDVTVSAAAVSASDGYAVYAMQSSADGVGNINVTLSDDISGVEGVRAENMGAGTNTINQTAGSSITTSNGHGILSTTTTGTATITVGDQITAGGAGMAGVRAASVLGAIDVNVQAAGNISADTGVDVSSISAPVTVTNAGTIMGTTAGVAGSSGLTGPLTVMNMGTISSANHAIDLSSNLGAMTINNASGAAISSTNTAIDLSASGNGSATITNAGTITGTALGLRTAMNGGTVIFNNNGIYNGRMTASGTNVAGSFFNNNAAGVANFTTGSSNFAGNLNNAGVINMGAGGGLFITGTANNTNRINMAGGNFFNTNGNFTNTGIFNAQNGSTKDTIAVGGNYIGGGQLWADFSDEPALTDVMNIAGTATGSTRVVMTKAGETHLLPGGFLPVVTVAGGSPSANAFVGDVFVDNGLIFERFAQNPNDANEFGILQEINPESLTLSSINLIAEAASVMLDEPMKPYITSRTDVADGLSQMGVWTRLGGGHADQSITTSVAGGDLALTSVDAVRTNYFTAQIGLDFAAVNVGGNWDLHFGVMGGWYSGRSHLAGGSSIKVETPFAGVYALASNGAFTLEGSARREWRNYKVVMPTLLGAGPQNVDGKSWAFAAHASYRLGGEIGLFATPFVGYQYADSDIDDIDIGGGAFYTSQGDKTKIGRAGVRVGYRFGDPSSATVEPFGGVSYLRNWSQKSDSAYGWDAPDTVFNTRAHTWKDVVRYTAGLDIRAKHSRVTGFVAANFDDDKQRDSTSVHAGLRINF